MYARSGNARRFARTRTGEGQQKTTPERSHPVGDKKGKKDKAKGNRQKEAKQAKAAKQKQDKQQPSPAVPDQRK